MTWTAPFTAITAAVMASADWNASARDNLLHLRALTGDPTASNELLVSSSTTAAAFGNPSGDTVLSAGSVTGTSASSAIPENSIAADRFQDASFDESAVSAAFADGAIAESLLATAVRNKLLFSGAIGLVRTAAEIPSGWSRESALDGRFAIGAGTTFSQTFDEATDYGSSWSHSHPLGSHTHSYSLSSGNADQQQTQMTGGSPSGSSPPQAHTHTASGTSGGPSGNSSSTAWTIPSRAYVYIRRS